MKIKMRITMILFCALTALYNLMPVHAFSEDEYTYKVAVNGVDHFFKSKSDYDDLIQIGALPHDTEALKESTRNGITYQYTTIFSGTKYYVFDGYCPLTPYWTKASSYNVSGGLSWNVSYGFQVNSTQFSGSYTHTNSVTVNIQANSEKYSKLGFYADIWYSKQKVDVYEYGVYQTSYYITPSYDVNKYLEVVYQ
ncbi:MAG: hypothetical protein IJ252_12120 [Solobacterium sp.]|nr:hypothetical protein [Solobacterium sp.]